MISTINTAIAKRREEGEKGFTLIELLVVVLIIGVLAAIAIPAFLNQRQGAWVAQVEADLKNAATAAESYAADNNGSFEDLTYDPEDEESPLAAFGYNPTEGVTLTVESATADGFTLEADHANLDENYQYDSATGRISEVGAPADDDDE